MRPPHSAVPSCNVTRNLRGPLVPAVLLCTLLLGSAPASALPPASGSKCSASWVNNPAAMACFIQGEEDLRSGVAQPHYVACTSDGSVFCCVNRNGGQDCEEAAAGSTGGPGRQDIDNLKLWATLEAQRSVATILGQVSASLDRLASRMEGMDHRGGPGMGPGMMAPHGPGQGPGGMSGYGRGPGPELNLTDEQRTRIDRIHEDLRRKQMELVGRMQGESRSRAAATDDAAADVIEDRIDQLRQQMMKNETAARKEIGAVLTPEQRSQLRRASP